MKLYSIRRTQRLSTSIRETWEFFSNPKNLPLITPSSLGLKITCDLPEEIYPGMIITYDVTPVFRIRVAWVSEITHVVEPHLFVDEQRFGPYRFWHHKHLFREVGRETEVEDVIHYALPLGLLGRVANGLIVNRELQKIFDHRRHVLEEMFGKAPSYG